MLKYYMANADKAGVGLECLPGVKQLLQELKVHHFTFHMYAIITQSDGVSSHLLCTSIIMRCAAIAARPANTRDRGRIAMHVGLGQCGQRVILSHAGSR